MKLRQVAVGSAFKLIFLSFLTSLLILATIFGIMAASGANTVRMNGRFIHGFAALPVSLVGACLVSLFFSGFATIGFLLMRAVFPNIVLARKAELVDESTV